ncbi:M15 family metallopeptidase [Prosthecochloris sp. SCSIO W1103]|uniref:M15 family metallopeptidase n=1 Tax=Prosthecochloris sp. SCSIO W1103 TaxID=2992244 RepID=UPI00223DF1DA|nr:M15 family metallopeptidase [Prosthecochloris sp. SCSIO W1103]UZJ37345.1 M15 family metallopeptidase [Prosthecochloris sp. SCSIO W1103]
MPRFSALSNERLGECDFRLQRLFREVIRHFDCVVLCGHRNRAEQERAFSEGTSKVGWPKSKHNKYPSHAVDVAPYDMPPVGPVNWQDRERMTFFAGFVLATAKQLGINIRWGGDWDRDTQVRDNRFDDLVHYELVEE